MMDIPSIFGPGDRSITLYEGINHHPDPDSIFRSKTVAQLGCGDDPLRLQKNGALPRLVSLVPSPVDIYLMILVT